MAPIKSGCGHAKINPNKESLWNTPFSKMHSNILVVFTFVAFATGAYVEVRDDSGEHQHPYDPDYYKEDLTVSKSHTVGQHPYYHGGQPHHYYYYPEHLQSWYGHGYFHPHHHSYYGGYPPYHGDVQKFLGHPYGYGHGYPHHFGDYHGEHKYHYQKHQGYNPLHAYLNGGDYPLY